MPPEPKQFHTIAATADRCLNLFQQCLQQSASISSLEMTLVEDQLARFSLWAANIGVFAGGRASLDHRLREAQEVHEVIIGLLETLEDQVEAWSHMLCESDSRSQISDTGLSSASDTITRSRRGVVGQIALLHRLSNTIRRASSEAHNAKVSTSFRIRDEEGNDVEPCLEVVFANYVRDRFRNVDEKILRRLVSAMILRRRRVLYKRSRFGHQALKVPFINSPPKKIPPPTDAPRQISTPVIPSAPPPIASEMPANSQAGVSATTLAVERFRKASTPSTVSGARTVALDSHEALPFPAPPLGRVRQRYRKIRKGLEEKHRLNLQSLSDKCDTESPSTLEALKRKAEADLKQDLDRNWDLCVEAIGEMTCPFCFYAVTAREMQNDAKWKAHVKNDLDAYVCLFDECETPDQLYSHTEQWLKHMQDHALRWRCNSKSHGLSTFLSRDRYIDHMRQAHQGAFSDAQLRVLADRNARAVEPLFESCPLCGSGDTSQAGTIIEHIVGHLRYLALQSLPPYEDEGSESSAAEIASSRASKPHKRSTIDNDPDRFITLIFEDFGSGTADEVAYLEQSSLENSFGRVDSRASSPSLESSSPIEKSAHFTHAPSNSGNMPLGRLRQFEWGFAIVNGESSRNLEDPVLQDLAYKQRLPSPVISEPQHNTNTDDLADGYVYSTEEILDNQPVDSMDATSPQPLGQTDAGNLLGVLPTDNKTGLAHQESHHSLKHTASHQSSNLPQVVEEDMSTISKPELSSSVASEDGPLSAISQRPATEAEESDGSSPLPSPVLGVLSKRGHMDATLMQQSGEVDGISDVPAMHPLPASMLGSPTQLRESILIENTPIGPILPFDTDSPMGHAARFLPEHLETGAIDNVLLDAMIARLLGRVGPSKKNLCLDVAEIQLICHASRELFLSQPVLLELNAPVKVVGDIHGQYSDLLRIFQLCGFPPAANYLFLGDYVDRGKQSLESILLLLCYKLRYPTNFFLLRGNHECANVTRVYGFYDECKRRTTIKTWKTFINVFNCMPVAAIVAGKIFCVHGGLSPSLSDLEDIRRIARPTDVPDYGLLNDLLWSDPIDSEQDWDTNDERGVSYCFGRRVIVDFLQRHDFDLICRAHMVVEDGYEFYPDRLLVTVFSAPNYCGEFDNWGGVMSVSDELLCSFELLKPSTQKSTPRDDKRLQSLGD
ncbi:uncharacterized protein BO72DRAFT_420696 [Aspergillus fijiensis CBS 313.89]|uniref:Serine/threonine-protein phosphatase n=1 Tax=Aspergillus fijiensis CBS 313.89 TaxID=1448319 RepID=A0A8G1S1T6_9EURO|nr:uncharacterized protein BO72DRAFT_420696 [Aspergillus fijiensis CBS 313.89]RAK81851.1 hypothetical protein BO72DRAFT_420696 [Aspergillus fijiensis CBS 313.89]